MKRMMNRKVIIGCLGILLGLTTLTNNVFGAETPGDFFRGKTLTLIPASVPGAATDLLARIIAPFLAKEISARVKVEVRKNDEAPNYVNKQGSRDGLTLGLVSKDALIGNDILKAPGAIYETEKFNFIADVSPACKMFQMSPKLPYRTLDALRKAKGLRAGAVSARGSMTISNAVMLEVLGLDGKVIPGFGRRELTLAIARGEVDFTIGTDNAAMRDEKDGYIVNLFAVGDKRSVAVPHVPSLSELGVKVAKEMASAYKFASLGGTAVYLPPGVPYERVEYLRNVFHALGNNKELQNELEKLSGSGVRRTFISGQELQEEMVGMKADKELANIFDTVFKKYTAIR